MSGRRHHIIPQFVLRQFSAENSAHIWVYPKGRKPYGTGSINILVEKDFYGEPDAAEADDALTGEEGRLAQVLAGLVAGGEGVIDDTDGCSDLVIHLMVRTKHLRLTFGEQTSQMIEGCMAFFEDEEYLRELFIAMFTRNQKPLLEAGLTPALIREFITPQSLPMLADAFLKEKGHAFTSMINQAKRKFIDGLPKLMAEKHNETLAKLEFMNQEKKALLKSLHWKVYLHPPSSLLLSDSACLFHYPKTRGFVSFDSHGPVYEAVYVPLTSSVLLVGSKEASHTPVSLDEFNREAAKVSRDVFVAAVESSYFCELQSLIGSNYKPATDEEVKQLIASSGKKWLLEAGL